MALSLDCIPFRLKETSNLLKLKYWKRHKLYLLKNPKGTHGNIERVNLHVYMHCELVVLQWKQILQHWRKQSAFTKIL